MDDLALSSYRYSLPEAAIAKHPPAVRGDSRLLVLERASGRRTDTLFTRLPEFLPPGALLVANNSAVVPARVVGHKASGGRVEMLLLTPLPLLAASPPDGQGWRSGQAEALLKAAKGPRPGETFACGPELAVEVLARGEYGRCQVRLRWQGELPALLARLGHMPLPPYIDRPDDQADAERYQTVYASAAKAGSVAAPTAGLHFTPSLLQALAQQGCAWAEVTLYVGYGTFSPVRVERLAEHQMHAEYYELSPEAVAAVESAKAAGRPVVAVGTTSARVLEGAWAAHNGLCPGSGWTDIFLYPGRPFRVVDQLITNFHLPESSLLMLVSALAGRQTILDTYAWALARGYRFFSYGDAMLIV